MKRFYTAAALCAMATALLPTSASAFEVSVDETMCPMETVGDAELDTWADGLAAAKGQMDDGQAEILRQAVGACAKKHNWTESDAISALEFNLAIIMGTAMSDALMLNGVFAPDFEVVLENRSADELRQILDDPENSPALKQVTEMIVSELGDELTDEIAGDLGSFIGFMAQSQLSAMKMMGLAD